MTAVLSGKRVLAPPKDIAEVKNAYEIYDHLAELNPYSIDDLLLAHRTMMQGLVHEAGEFRSRPVGVVDNQGNVLHFGTLPQYVPYLMEELVQWTESSPFPLLIKSCVFHYEFEVIHPFADGNGRIGAALAHPAAVKVESLICVAPDRIHHPRPSGRILCGNQSV